MTSKTVHYQNVDFLNFEGWLLGSPSRVKCFFFPSQASCVFDVFLSVLLCICFVNSVVLCNHVNKDCYRLIGVGRLRGYRGKGGCRRRVGGRCVGIPWLGLGPGPFRAWGKPLVELVKVKELSRQLLYSSK